jgi:protease II
VGTCRVSPNHNFLAYTLDTTGSENFVLQIKDLKKNCIFQNYRVEGVVSLAWAQDSHTLFYTLCDQSQRPHRQILHASFLSLELENLIDSYCYFSWPGYIA